MRIKRSSPSGQEIAALLAARRPLPSTYGNTSCKDFRVLCGVPKKMIKEVAMIHIVGPFFPAILIAYMPTIPGLMWGA